MAQVFQILRSSTAGGRPAAKLAGEPWVNHADLQFGVHDGTAARDLVAVRFHSTTAVYAIGDFVVQAGGLYRCIAPTVAGAFVPANWEAVGAVDLSPYLLLAGGAMTGSLVLAADPVAPLEPVSLQFLDTELLSYLPLTAGPTVPLTGQLHLPAALITLPAEATNKAYVDAADTLLQSQIDLLASNLLWVGSIDVVTDTGTYSVESGIPAGPLPAASVANTNMYVIVTDGGAPLAGEIPAGTYALGDWLASDGTAWVHLPLGQAAVVAGNVGLTPPLSQPTWTNVQLAIDGLETNKVDLAGDTMTGALVMAADPTLPLHPVTLQYLQNAILDAGVY